MCRSQSRDGVHHSASGGALVDQEVIVQPPAAMAALGSALSSRRVFAQFDGMRLTSSAGSLRPCRGAVPAQRRCQHSRLTVTARQGEVGVGLFGTKAGMTQIFTPDGLALPATVIALEEGNVVAQIKTAETDGYNAVQVGEWHPNRTPQPHCAASCA